MLTRCPHCHTTFRVTPEQLKVRQGRVRCGSCQAVFNALDTLEEEAAPVAPAAAAPATEPAPAPAPGPETEPDSWADPRGPDTRPAPEAAPESDHQAEPEPRPLPEPPLQSQPAAPEIAPEPEPAAPNQPEPPVAPVLPLVAPAATPVESAPAAAEPPAADAPVLPTVAEPTPAPEPEPDLPPAAELEPFYEEPATRRRWPWVLGSLLALVLLALQAVIHFRVELAVIAPEARPTLKALCDLAGIDLPLPARIEYVGIETSDLHPDSAKPGHFLLMAGLRNRAPFAQRWPHLELTLTDALDQALLRRVLAPAEYLPAEPAPAAGFAARGEQAVRLAVNAPDVAAVGYRLYVFYP